MRYNRLIYDKSSYNETLEINNSSLDYNLDILKFENPLKCRPELGILGGSQVSHIKGNLVDLENELRGQGNTLEITKTLDMSLQHLRAGKIINLGPEK